METYRNCDGSDRLPAIPGHEVSGIVESVAPGMSDVSIGDEVYALTSFCQDGAAAEYIAVHAADLAPKPKTLSVVQAAAVPLLALMVWQATLEPRWARTWRPIAPSAMTSAPTAQHSRAVGGAG